MEIIDAHAHVLPFIAGKRNQMLNTGEFYGKVRRGSKGEWRPGARRGLVQFAPPSFHPTAVSPEMLIAYMEWAGVDRAVLMQAPMYGNHNEFTAAVTKANPTRFPASVGLADPRSDGQGVDDLEFIKDLGHRGVKLEIPDQPFWIDDETYNPFWQKIEQLGLTCCVDLGWDPPVNPYNFQIDGLQKVVSRFPKINFLIIHLGISYLTDVSQKYPFPILQKTLALKQYPNVWFDITGLEEFCEDEKPPADEYPFPRAQEIVRAAVESVGSERLIWGTDFPSILVYCTYPQSLNLVRYHCSFLSEKDRENILGGTVRRLFRLGT